MPARRRRGPIDKSRQKKKKKQQQQQQQQQQQPAQEDGEGWYSIRRILEEKRVKGCVLYLVDWDDDAVSGDKYPPSWTKEVTPAALEEWEALKRAPPQEAHPEANPEAHPEAHSEAHNSQSAKWRQLSRPETASVDRRSKNQHQGAQHLCSDEPGLDFAPTPSVCTASEVFDTSYQEFEDLSGPPAVPLVAISRKPPAAFDSAEYHSVTDSQASAQSLADLEAEDSQIAIYTRSQRSQRTIPDSQDPSSPASWPIPLTVETQILPIDPDSSSPLSSLGEHVPSTPVGLFGKSSSSNSKQPNSDRSEEVSLSQGSSRHPYTPSGNQGSEQDAQILHSPASDIATDWSTPQSPSASGEASRSIMDTPSSRSAPPQYRMSAVEELSRLFGLGPLPESAPQTDPQEDPERERERERERPDAPSESAQLPQIQSQADIPADMSIEPTSTIEVGKSAWTPTATESPSVVTEQPRPRPSATQELLRMVEMSFNTPSTEPDPLPTGQTPGMEQITVSPADITRQDEPILISDASASVIPMSSLFGVGVGVGVGVGQEPVTAATLYGPPGSASSSQQQDQEQPKSDSSELSIPPPDLAPDEFTVTLPLQASLRPMYDRVLREYKRHITDFGRALDGESKSESKSESGRERGRGRGRGPGPGPDEAVTKKINELFGRLHNLCDHPVDVSGTSLEDLAPKDIAKYCCDVNAKFSFIFEFLQILTLKKRRARILIVARSPDLLRLIHHLTSALQLDCTGEAIENDSGNEHSGSGVQVVLALATEKIDKIDPSSFDVIIGYDSSFTTSHFGIEKSFSRDRGTRGQLVLKLVTTHTIEHIDLRVSELAEGLSDTSNTERSLERKQVVLAAIVKARSLLNDPERGYLEPHEVAEVFAQYLSGEEEDDVMDWEPQPLPDDLFEALLRSQRSQSRSRGRSNSPYLENGRKRKHDAPDDSEAKRIRVFSTHLHLNSHSHAHAHAHAHHHHPPLPDEVRELLEAAALKSHPTRPGVMVQVPLPVLQVIAEQVSEYERRIKDVNLDAEYQATISNLESRVKEYERTTTRIFKSNRAALQDRSRFEAERQAAEAAQKAAVGAAEKEVDKVKKKMEHLEETILRLTQDPNSSDPSDTPLAKSEKLLEAAQDKVATLERRLENSHADSSYMQTVYQEATTAAAAIKAELDALKTLNEELGKKASDNTVLIQQIHANNSQVLCVRQNEDLKTQVREREAEISRIREELRHLKNGRRETRGVSVPHSPRMGVMSPRVGRGYGSASRGTSPASVAGLDEPSTPFARQQPGNPRWNHLRE